MCKRRNSTERAARVPAQGGDYLDATRAFWRARTDKHLTREDAREMAHDLLGFFTVLREWSIAETERKTRHHPVGSGPARRPLRMVVKHRLQTIYPHEAELHCIDRPSLIQSGRRETAMTRKSNALKAQTPGSNRAVVYARVSSKEQEKEGFSIPAQLKLLKEYAAANGFAVAQEYIDVETAKQTGRAAFGEMVAYLKAHPSVRVMLVEKTDRLYRNLKDWVTVDELDVEMHFPKEGVVLSREFAILGKVHARHQGADGEELHRQPVRGSPQGHAGKGRAGHLADQGAARLSQHHRPGRQEDHRRRSGDRADHRASCSNGMRAATFR